MQEGELDANDARAQLYAFQMLLEQYDESSKIT